MKLRAPFAYWGSKNRMAPWVIDRLPAHDHYIEGCAGSAAILAVKPPVAAETINDTYGEVVNFFRVLRDPATRDLLVDMVAFTPYSRAEFRESLDFPPEDPVHRAWAFVVSMQMAVVPGRTGWSYSTAGASAKKANKPGRWATMPELLRIAGERFERVQVESMPVIELIERYDRPGVLHLIDPPYTEESRPSSTGGSSGYVDDSFNHEELIDAITRSKHASFAVTHYPDPIYDESLLLPGGDFTSHRNNPNSDVGRDVKVERLYVLDRGQPREAATDNLFAALVDGES